MRNTKLLFPKIKKIFGKYPVILGYVFGSYAKGRVGRMSDLDLAIYFDKKKVKKEKWQELIEQIKDELEISFRMPEKIDLVSLNEVPPLLEREIVYDGKLIYNKNDGIRAHYEAQAISRWLDWKWYQDRFDKAIEKEFGKRILKRS